MGKLNDALDAAEKAEKKRQEKHEAKLRQRAWEKQQEKKGR